jgi:hypothetical protein
MKEKYFKNIILYKSILLILIIIWGGTVQISSAESSDRNNLTDLGGILFSIFSVLYLVTSYQLYNFKVLGKKLFAPLVATFIVLGFATETINPIQIDKNLFYLVIFYIVSPIFFIAQGLVMRMIYFSSIKEKFADH